MSVLPKGYTPLESIPLPQSPEIKWYILPGFSTFEMAKSKVEDLIGKSGVVTYEIHQQQDSYVILLPHTVVQYLTESEREKLIRNYRIRSDVNQPVVWRLMSKKHVEEFFKTGELQISTYAKFAQNDSLIRKDDDEGNVTLYSEEGSLTSKMAIGVGANALVLCTSLSQNNSFSDGTTYEACIEIEDLLLEKQEECEYRIVWLTDQEQREAIKIKVPEAIACCRPIYF